MKNFFKEQDNRIKPLIKNSDNFLLRIITEKETLLKNQQVINLLNRLMFECEQDLKNNIARNFETLKEEHKPEEMWQVSNEWIEDNFVKHDNRAIFVVENKKGDVLSVGLGWLDDKEIRNWLQVPNEVGTFCYVPFTITEERYKNTGLATLMFNKLITMLKKPERELPQPIIIATSVNIAQSIKSNNEEFNHVMNLPRYFMMWNNRFENNKIQIKHRELKTLIQEGKELIDFKDITNNSDEYDADKVNEIIIKEQPNVKDGWEMRGFFVRGEDKKTYAESKEVKNATGKRFLRQFNLSPKF